MHYRHLLNVPTHTDDPAPQQDFAAAFAERRELLGNPFEDSTAQLLSADFAWNRDDVDHSWLERAARAEIMLRAAEESGADPKLVAELRRDILDAVIANGAVETMARAADDPDDDRCRWSNSGKTPIFTDPDAGGPSRHDLSELRVDVMVRQMTARGLW